MPCKVLIVDDESGSNEDVYALLADSNAIDVVGNVVNRQECFKQIPRVKPDVIIISVSLSKVDILTILKMLMIQHSIPVVILSNFFDEEHAFLTFDALRYGAVDFISGFLRQEDDESDTKKQQLIKQICTAASIKTKRVEYIRAISSENTLLIEKNACQNLVVLGVAEGGYGALLKIIPQLEVNESIAYMVVFYEQSEHIAYFINYLNNFSQVFIQRSINNDVLMAGVCYFSSGNEYVTVHEEAENLSVYVSPAPFSSHRGSIDMLMFSAAEILGNYTIGAILSGIGSDGSEGLEEIIRVGGNAIIQSPENCLYKGMSLAALNLCDVEAVVTDKEIAAEIKNFLVNSVT